MDSGAVEVVNAGAANGGEKMAVPVTTTNTTTNATLGSPPASAIAAAAAAAAAAAKNDDNNDKDDDGVDLDVLHHPVRDLRRMLDASADCLAGRCRCCARQVHADVGARQAEGGGADLPGR